MNQSKMTFTVVHYQTIRKHKILKKYFETDAELNLLSH